MYKRVVFSYSYAVDLRVQLLSLIYCCAFAHVVYRLHSYAMVLFVVAAGLTFVHVEKLAPGDEKAQKKKQKKRNKLQLRQSRGP